MNKSERFDYLIELVKETKGFSKDASIYYLAYLFYLETPEKDLTLIQEMLERKN